VSPNQTPAENPSEGSEEPEARVPIVPDGFDSEEAFLKYVREEYAADAGYDRTNREAALSDLRFLAGDQWDPNVLAIRKKQGRPCLTINVLPQFVGQVIGDRRMNKTSIRVAPKRDGHREEAEVRSGLIRGIEAHCRADRVYDAVCEDQVSCGIGNMRVDLEYAANDVFDQDIMIRHIPNPLAVVWDRMSIDPTGRDARHCFVEDAIPMNVFEKLYPGAPPPSSLGDDVTATLTASGWFEKDFVRLTEFWRLVDKPATFALMNDGDVKDVTGQPPESYMQDVMLDANGNPRIRQSYRTYARMNIVCGHAVLTEDYEIPLTRLPIIKVEGRVVRVGDDRVRFGLVRLAKDSQRMKNLWRSNAAELLALAPKAQWVASEDSVEGRENEWRMAHLNGELVMIYNKNTEAPQRVDPPAIPGALLQEAQLNQQDIKDVTGIHEASLGMRSNEISGRAINARKMQGDIAVVIYHDNMNAAILEVGDVVNQLLPLAYDNTRTALFIGEDDKRLLITLNDPSDETSPNITSGRYEVSLETGPSFATQRDEAREAMTTLIQTAPQLFDIAGDLLVKNMDWPGAYEISERLRDAMKKAGVLPADEEGEEDPAAQQAAAAAEEQAMMMQQMQEQEMMAQAEHAQMMRDLEAQKMQEELAKAQLATREAEARAQKAEADAAKARADAAKAETEANVAPVLATQKIDLAERSAGAKELALSARAAQQQRPAPRGGRTPKKGS
jgi:hypothetical protein